MSDTNFILQPNGRWLHEPVVKEKDGMVWLSPDEARSWRSKKKGRGFIGYLPQIRWADEMNKLYSIRGLPQPRVTATKWHSEFYAFPDMLSARGEGHFDPSFEREHWITSQLAWEISFFFEDIKKAGLWVVKK